MNGASVQHAAELLLPNAIEDGALSASASTYVCCLEDFVFSYLCGSALLVSGNLPTAGRGGRPGATLSDIFKEAIRPINVAVSGPPDALLLDASARALIAMRLKEVERVVDLVPFYFKDWIGREAVIYFGSDESVFREISPEMYVFKKSPPYMTDGELQSMISMKVINVLAKTVSLNLPEDTLTPQGRRPVSSALCEFVSRNVLTNAVIALWYDRLYRPMQAEGTRYLPHVTRNLTEGIQARPVDQILVPHVLNDVLRNSSPHRPMSFVNVLIEMRDSRYYRRLRELLNDVAHLPPVTRSRAERLISEDIMAMTRGAGLKDRLLDMDSDRWRLGYGMVSRYRSALRKIVRPLNSDDNGMVLKFFPHLNPQNKGSRTVIYAERHATVIANSNISGTVSVIHNAAGRPIDSQALAEELSILRQAAKTKATTLDHDLALGQLAEAEAAARADDGAGTVTALKKAGSWALGIAEKISVPVAVEAIKAATGL